MNRTKPISGELLKLKEEICEYAKGYGLDFYEVIFEVCDYDTINILASLGGFPNRYPHWKFGMAYDQMYKGYSYGLQKIYEMVVNTNPCYAYLLNANHLVDQKIVMAHVYGHADFFKNNAWFSNTNRRMMDVMANHGTKIRRYMDRFGQEKVENFIDKVLSLENLLDTSQIFKRDQIKSNIETSENEEDGRSNALKSYMRSRLGADKKNKGKQADEAVKNVEIKPQSPRDIMGFLLENAPLKEWESDIIGILREEAYYFLPQRITKIMNEGWASYWHSTIMTQNALKSSEIIHFADHHSGVMAMSRQQLNPYKIGIELFRDIEHRWDCGKFGKEYNECDNLVAKENWNNELGLGRDKIFEVRKTHNDITFIDEFFTQDFCERQKLFTYNYNPTTGRNEISSKEFDTIKGQLLLQLTNFGTPLIKVESANYANRGELLLTHVHFGADLDMGHARETMRNIYFVWKRPVNISTKIEDKEVVYKYDGKEFKSVD